MERSRLVSLDKEGRPPRATPFGRDSAGSLYQYVRHGRSPVNAALVAGCVAYLIYAWNFGSGFWGILVLGAGLYGLVGIVQNRSWGMELDGRQLTVFNGDWTVSTPLHDISEIDIVQTSDDTVVRVVRTDRSRFTVPSYCYDSAEVLRLVCADYGVRVTGNDG